MSGQEQPLSGVEVMRIPVDRPQPVVAFLLSHGGGVMDLIAHFWERLPQTPPLQRDELHLLVASRSNINSFSYIDTSKACLVEHLFTGAMLYVPKAYRADVLTLDQASAHAFAEYIKGGGEAGNKGLGAQGGAAASGLSLASGGTPARLPIDFLTGFSDSIQAMLPLVLPLVGRKTPARQLVNEMMQLPPEQVVALSSSVRLARDADAAMLNRWRKQYKEERGILFDADIDAWVGSQRVYVLEHEGQVAACAKFDLELPSRVEIGGIYTFPEFRKRGFGRILVEDLAARIRTLGKMPTLQVDRENTSALRLYQRLGWVGMGGLARVWLTK